MEVDHTRKILGKDYNPSIMDVKEEGWERTRLCPSIFLTPCISPPEKKVSSSLVNECHGLFFFFFFLLQSCVFGYSTSFCKYLLCLYRVPGPLPTSRVKQIPLVLSLNPLEDLGSSACPVTS